jgi:Reverse transcriptase (RNA-dependent DNA polymerase)
VSVREQDVEKTTVMTPFGTFEYLRMPFGLRNAGQTFQCLMDSVLASLPYCFVYMDDVLVASTSPEQQVAARGTPEGGLVLSRLQQKGLVLNIKKCSFGQVKLDHLGHNISAPGIQPMAACMEAIKRFPLLTTVGHLHIFLGIAIFYRRFIPPAAEVMKPLTDAVKGGQAKSVN